MAVRKHGKASAAAKKEPAEEIQAPKKSLLDDSDGSDGEEGLRVNESYAKRFQVRLRVVVEFSRERYSAPLAARISTLPLGSLSANL